MARILHQCEYSLSWEDLRKRLRRPYPEPKRTPGLHLSGVIRYVLQASKQWSEDDERDSNKLAAMLGTFWEEGVVGLWPKLVWQPGEQLLDGVRMSPDGLSEGEDVHPGLAGEQVLEEFKYTLKSAHTHGDVLREKLWIWQIMGYCKALGLLYARLHVCWAAWNYRPPSPKYACYLIGFSQKELDMFWEKVVLVNKDDAPVELEVAA